MSNDEGVVVSYGICRCFILWSGDLVKVVNGLQRRPFGGLEKVLVRYKKDDKGITWGIFINVHFVLLLPKGNMSYLKDFLYMAII